ncbi:MAG: hypothetical protein QGG64_23320 [Candidatus Latescibacteria bacterium]|nr:hypothetical protein [Candidatus Latescibacterota bacterium]
MEAPDFSEDDDILACLSDEADAEAFTNLMEHAHERGISAADFVREEPKRTSRKSIRKLCLANHKQGFHIRVRSALKSLWERPSSEPSVAQALYGMPDQSGRSHQNGYHERDTGE